MLALHERASSGVGQLVDVALFDVAFAMAAASGCASEYLVTEKFGRAVGKRGLLRLLLQRPGKRRLCRDEHRRQ
jgi:crotonobetainyl-CoA:carnitine CoA-transferase CaiB-like acyl-CoA transferase